MFIIHFKKWCQTISTILSTYKSIQYKLPSQSFSKLEKQFFWNHKTQEYEGECTECGMCCEKEVNGEIVPCKYLDLKGE